MLVARVPPLPRHLIRPTVFTALGAVFGWPILIAVALHRTTSSHVAVIAAVIEAKDTITSNIKSASEELLELAKVGIDLAAVTDHLEADGVEKFMSSWESLLAEVEHAKQ